MYEPKHMKLWEHPENYVGPVWPGWYVYASRNRDSDIVDRANFQRMLEHVGGEQEGRVVVARSSHWLVGWIDIAMIHQDADEALAKADEALAALADYPVLDDELVADMEAEEMDAAWKAMSVRERGEVLKCCGFSGSIFAARRDAVPPDNDDGSLREWLLA